MYKLLDARIPTDAKSQLHAQQKTQKLYFNRGANSLPTVKTGDTVRLKTKNCWKPAKVTKLVHTPRSVIVTSNGTLYRRNKTDIIKTPDVNKGTITSPTSDRGITKSPGSDIMKTHDIIQTRFGGAVQPTRLNGFVYY